MNQKKKNILLGVLIVGVISMSVAFAALSTNLSISGSASIPTTSWNIHFANNHDSTQSPHQDGTVNRGAITGVQFAATSITGFTATLYQPNDEVVYEFDIVNEGTIDAQLDNFTKTLTCNTSDCSMITYTIDCEDASHNDANQSDYILAHGQSVSCVMKIKYNDQTNSGNGIYEQGAVNATATASWIYKQVETAQGGNSGSGSGGNEEPGGNNEPTPPSPSGNYTYTSKGVASANSVNNAWSAYIRTDANGYKEVCKVFDNGTACLGYNDYPNNIAAKAAEFEAVMNEGGWCDSYEGYFGCGSESTCIDTGVAPEEGADNQCEPGSTKIYDGDAACEVNSDENGTEILCYNFGDYVCRLQYNANGELNEQTSGCSGND